MSLPVRVFPILPDQATRDRQDRLFIECILGGLIILWIIIALAIVCRL